jgi:hypothetical protein
VGGNDIMRLRAIYMMEQYRSMSVCIDTHAPVSLESWEHALSKFETLLQETLYWDYALILPPVGKLLRGRTENRRIVMVLCRSGIEKLELEGPLYNGNRTLC